MFLEIEDKQAAKNNCLMQWRSMKRCLIEVMGRAFEVRKQSMAKTAAKKSKIYARYGREIYIAAKGMPDPEINIDWKNIRKS